MKVVVVTYGCNIDAIDGNFNAQRVKAFEGFREGKFSSDFNAYLKADGSMHKENLDCLGRYLSKKLALKIIKGEGLKQVDFTKDVSLSWTLNVMSLKDFRKEYGNLAIEMACVDYSVSEDIFINRLRDTARKLQGYADYLEKYEDLDKEDLAGIVSVITNSTSTACSDLDEVALCLSNKVVDMVKDFPETIAKKVNDFVSEYSVETSPMQRFISSVKQAVSVGSGVEVTESTVNCDGEDVAVYKVTVSTSETGDCLEAVFHKGTEELIDLNVIHKCTCGHCH